MSERDGSINSISNRYIHSGESQTGKQYFFSLSLTLGSPSECCCLFLGLGFFSQLILSENVPTDPSK